jgi:type IV secretory pathway VirB10-like protein
MLSNRAAVAALGLVAMAGAAGTGAFLATQRAQPPAIVADAAAPALAQEGVDATEATIDPVPAVEPSTADVAPPVAEEPAPRVRREARERPVPAPPRRATPAPAATARVETPTPPRSTEPVDETARPNTAAIERPEPSPASADTYTGDSRTASEPAPSLTPAPRFEEVTVPAEAVIGLQLENTITSDTARVEDRVEARVTRDVRAGGEVAIPAGSRVLGSVSVVERGGKMKERARLGVRFHTVILADGTELPLQTDTVYREGESPANASAAKVGGGAIGGAILGAILGGGKGAAIGAGVGAGAGTAAVMAGGRRAAEIRSGSPVTVKVLSPVSVTVER